MVTRQTLRRLLFASVLLLPNGVSGQHIQFGISDESPDAIITQAGHSRLLNCCPDCPECRAYRRRCQTYGVRPGGVVCPPSTQGAMAPEAQAEPGAEGAAPSPDSEGITAPSFESIQNVPDLGQLSGSFGAGGGVLSAAPGMIGDFFSYGGQQMAMGTLAQNPNNPTTISLAGGDRRFKIVENNSPFPMDRVFFNYHYFKNAVIPADAGSIPAREQSLDRYMFGLEKTFCDELWSAELRIPFASGLDSVQFGDPGAADNSGTEFGNMALALKRLLWNGPLVSASVGLGMVFPTADDMQLFATPSSLSSQLLIENEAFFLQPFLGVRYTPGTRLWFDFFSQLDLATNGNSSTLILPGLVSGDPPRTEERVLTDQNLLFLDASLGYWLYQDPCGCGIISGLAPIVELHYSTTIQNADGIQFRSGSNEDELTNPFNRMDVLNLTGGLRVKFGRRSFLTVAAAVPLRTDKEDLDLQRHEEKLFDVEFGVQFVQLF